MEANPSEGTRKFHVPKGDFDFQQAIQEHGFLKARQLLRQAAVARQQEQIEKLDRQSYVSRQPMRVMEAIKLSKTLGKPNSESAIEKILETTSKKPSLQPGKSEKDCVRDFDVDVSIRRSLISGDGSLLLAQVGLDYLPNAMGETLYMQTSFLKSLSIPRNHLVALLSHQLPQISMYHLRYIQDLNLSGNKIKYLPPEMGQMSILRELNLSYNSLSTLPLSISRLRKLQDLNLNGNSFANLPFEMRNMCSLEKLHMMANVCAAIPAVVTALPSLKLLDISRNMLCHMAIMPPLLKPNDIWHPYFNEKTGQIGYINILTKEKVNKIVQYTGKGIERDAALHTFQEAGTPDYRRRKMWLSANQVNEWEALKDPATGLFYYQNNVSGASQWTMPNELNIFGACLALEELRVNFNMIAALPTSITKITTLKILVAHTNRLHDLPDHWSDLKALTFLDVHNNELKLLPPSICDCISLKTLCVYGNNLVRLPDLLGTLPQLEKIDAMANRLSQIPFSLGYSESLVDLNVQENPLVDPPLSEVVKGSAKLKWYLRNRLLLDERGVPPHMEYHDMSIMHEITIIKPEIREKIKYVIELSRKNGIANFQMMGIIDIPKEVLKVKHIKRLQLDFNNHLELSNGFPKEIGQLRMLSVRACRLPQLADNINNLKRLTHLNLEENLLETLPNTFTSLRCLQFLDISKNHLFGLPRGFENLSDLKSLNLDGNRIEYLPSGIGKILSLTNLNLARNRLNIVPDLFCELTNLKKLNIESNCLFSVPAKINKLSLVELRIGHNRIEWLPDDLFDGPMAETMKLFSCCENNLMELPLSLHQIDPEGLLEADFNPLVSPPAYLLTEGLATVQSYLRIRQLRIEDFDDLISAEDFDFVRENIGPIAHEVLADGTGFLTPDDILDFDYAVHEYLNGEYFKCPASGEEIVNSITKLRDYRENDLYLTCLNTLIGVLERIERDPYSDSNGYTNAIIIDTKRPWGWNGENIGCWGISLHSLLHDAPPNDFHRNKRSSLISMVKAALPEMPIPFTVDLLKDSLRLYVSPYGQVAETENLLFPACDCLDDRQKPLRHKACTKTAVVMARVIYSDEEANRRAAEEDEMFAEFKDIEESIRIWLLTAEGKFHMEREVKNRIRAVQAMVSLQTEVIMAEQMKMNKAREKLVGLQRRKKLMEAGESELSHGYTSVQDAVNQIDEAEEAIQKHQKRLALLQDMKTELVVKLGVKRPERRKQACEDLIMKYCYFKNDECIRNFRKEAVRKGWRRPWDGDNGADYLKWYELRYGRGSFVAGVGREETETDNSAAKAKELAEAEQKLRDDFAQAGEALKEYGELPPEYSWKGTDDRKKFYFPLYERYKYSRSMAHALFG